MANTTPSPLYHKVMLLAQTILEAGDYYSSIKKPATANRFYHLLTQVMEIRKELETNVNTNS